MNDLVERVAREIYSTGVKALGVYAPDSDAFRRAIDDGWPFVADEARAAILAVLDGIAESSEAQMDAANALPVSEQINSIMATTAMRSGSHSILPPRPNSPLEQWYRAMIAALQKEIADAC